MPYSHRDSCSCSPGATAERRLDLLDRSYRRLGGKYAAFADHLSVRRGRLLAEAQADIEDFALLTEAWAPLVRAVRATPVPRSSW